MLKYLPLLPVLIGFILINCQQTYAQGRPNVIIIYADDLGYGDLGCYGATQIKTPHLDALAAGGLRFTDAHSTSATCTPSRYALMTGNYPWRSAGIAVLAGDARNIIPSHTPTLPKLFKSKGYSTGIVGKWHLGLGEQVEKDWGSFIKPGPNEAGFDYSFIFPATADRVPTVFLENGRVQAYDTADPIRVDYKAKIGNEPTGKENPELLKMKASPNHGHDNTIVNGIGRIGWMTGGHRARWTDEEMPLTFLEKARQFIRNHQRGPFFLYYSLTEPHVPRMPSTMFKGKSGLGYRGDAILQLDWTVGEIMKLIKGMGLEKNTLVVFTSDNGPVLDDGYEDGAVTELNGHNPFGPFRGAKYSTFEAGTRVPFIISMKGRIRAGVSHAMLSQVDLLMSFRNLLGSSMPLGETDSEDMLAILLGSTGKGRETMITDAGSLALRKGDWKYIQPKNGPAVNNLTKTETGNNPLPQLYNLSTDPGEKTNLAEQYPEKLKEMEAELERIKNKRKQK